MKEMPTAPETIAAWQARRRLGRRPLGISAVLLPFTEQGQIDEAAFVGSLERTLNTGLLPAVNMDTGYVNLLTDLEKARVLRLTHETLKDRVFVAGAYIEGQDGAVIDLYRREIDRIAMHGGTPILFQTVRTHGLSSSAVAEIYAAATAEVPTAYAFELGQMFAPNGEIWSEETFRAILSIEQIRGIKHSSLDRMREMERLAVRDAVRPEFRIFTGNDLGIDMIEYGSDYLLGLSSFCPEGFALRDRAWEQGAVEYYGLSDALQLLGNTAFRPPVPAYKHSAAIYLQLTGQIPCSAAHPQAPRRPDWEGEILAHCHERIDRACASISDSLHQRRVRK